MKDCKTNNIEFHHSIDIVDGKLKIKTVHHYLTVVHYLTETELNISKFPFILIAETMKYNEKQLIKKAIELGYKTDSELSLDNSIKDKEFIV